MTHIDIKVHGAGGTIVMTHPESGNALSHGMLASLEQALDDLHQERRVRYVILTAKGPHFSSGLDLKELLAVAPQDTETDLPNEEVHRGWRTLAELLLKMMRFPKPLVAAVDGHALGGGFALALACDIVVASTRAQFGSPAAHRGLLAAGVAPLLWFRLGGSIAAKLLLTGKNIDADSALACGLASDMVAADQIWATADTLGQSIAEAPAESIQMTKRLLNESVGETVMTQLMVASGMGAAATTTGAASEGLRAFVEKRPPEWN